MSHKDFFQVRDNKIAIETKEYREKRLANTQGKFPIPQLEYVEECMSLEEFLEGIC